MKLAENQIKNENVISYRDLLRNEYNSRREKNTSFSLRAFARTLGINKTSLSEAIALRRHLTAPHLRTIAERLSWTGEILESALKEIHEAAKKRALAGRVKTDPTHHQGTAT